jgi:hypothetical protein
MGLHVPLRDDRLMVKKKVIPLSALARIKKFSDTENKDDQELSGDTVQADLHVNFLNSTYKEHTNDNR